jgi:hypothetical protein
MHALVYNKRERQVPVGSACYTGIKISHQLHIKFTIKN